MQIKLISITSDAEKVIEEAGRTAYQSQDKICEGSAKRFIRMLISRGHTSVLEHASATFKISGISRSCSHQLVRHRLASFTQKSQRYVPENNFRYVVPASIKNDGRALEIFLELMEKIQKTYDELDTIFGIPNEDCRFVLPEACETEIVMTANFREWRHIIQLRIDKSAQWEIRGVCQKILEILNENAPSCFGDLIE